MTVMPPIPAKLTKAGMVSIPWAWTSPRYRALDFEFAVRTMDPVLGRYLGEMLESLAVASGNGAPGGDPRMYSVVDRGPRAMRRYALHFGSRCLASGPTPNLPLAHLLWSLNRNVTGTARGCLLLHAAAAERDGAAVVLPAPPDSGKTTVVAGLVSAGFRYVTDEAVAVSFDSLLLRPFPKPLAVDAGSWSVLSDLDPALRHDLGPYAGSQWHVGAASIRADAVAPPCQPRLIVAPTYRPGQAAALVAVSPASVVALLAANSFNFARLGARGFDTAVALARQAPCYRLFTDDLAGAVGTIEALMAAGPGEADGAARADGSGPALASAAFAGSIADWEAVAPAPGGETLDPSFVPRRPSRLRTAELGDEAVVWDEVTGLVHVLNTTAAAVWACCDGEGTVDQVVDEVAAAYHLDREVIGEDVLAAVRGLGARGLLEGVKPYG